MLARRFVRVIVAACFLGSFSACSTTSSNPGEPTGAIARIIDPQAEKALDSVAKNIQSLHSFSCVLNTIVQRREGKAVRVSTSEYAFESPNKFMARSLQNEGAAWGAVSNGKYLYRYKTSSGIYTETAAPGTLAEISANDRLVGYGLISYFHAPDAVAKLTTSAQQVTYGGIKQIDGKDCQLVTTVSNTGTGQDLYISTDANPFVIRSVVRTANGATTLTDLAEIKINMPPAEGALIFKPKPGWEKVLDINTGGLEHMQKMLVGNPAPDLTVTDIEGKEVKLSDEKNKNIVVLYLWSADRTNYSDALRPLNRVAKGYEGKTVRFIAVNEGEAPPLVEAFAKEKKLDALTMATDEDRDAQNAFGGYRTVVIGKDGTVLMLDDIGADYIDRIKDFLSNRDIPAVEAGTN